MKNWPHQILDELLENYSESPTDLTRFCIETLKISASDRNNAKKVKEILSDFSARGYLEWYAYKWKVINNERKLDTENNGPNKTAFAESDQETFDNNRIEAHLTSPGLDYSLRLRREREQHQSIIRTNQSVRKTNGTTTIIAGTAALFSILVFFRDCNKEERINQLQKAVTDSSQQIRQTLQYEIQNIKESQKKHLLPPLTKDSIPPK